MKCAKCGSDNAGPQSRFCRECGTPLASPVKPSGGTDSKRLCEGCMGAFNPSELAQLDGRELCTLCMARERRRSEMTAPSNLVQPPPSAGSRPVPGAPQPQGYYYEQGPVRRTSGWALASLIMAFFLPFMGIIAGIIALRQIKRNPDELEGKGMAVAGIALGSLSTVMAACIIGLIALSVFFAVGMAEKSMEEEKASLVVAAIVAGQPAYVEQFGRHGDLDELVSAGLISGTAVSNASGYDFTVELLDEGSDFICRAIPRNQKKGGHLYADRTGRITYDADKPAGPESTPFRQRIPGFNVQTQKRPVQPRTGG